MATISPQNFRNIAQYLNAPVGKIHKKDNVYVRVNNNQTATGVINIIFALLKESTSGVGPKNLLDEVQIHQWLEFGLVYAGNVSSNQNVQTVLQELNNILSTKTYLVDNRLTMADVFLYYILINNVSNLSILDKERFLNVSRWFDNVQQDPALRQKHILVNFSTNYLAGVVPARH